MRDTWSECLSLPLGRSRVNIVVFPVEMEKREKIDAFYAFTRYYLPLPLSLHRLSFGSGSGVQHSYPVMSCSIAK